MTRHVIGVFSEVDHVQRAVEALLAEGTDEGHVSVLRWENSGHGEKLLEYEQEERNEAIGGGFWGGTAVGAIAGLLAGAVGVVAAPFGAVAVMGALASALGGAAIGATVGSFTGSVAHLGLPVEAADHLLDRLEAGATILAVAVPTTEAQKLESRLKALGAEETRTV
jgi:hypothetical protein